MYPGSFNTSTNYKTEHAHVLIPELVYWPASVENGFLDDTRQVLLTYHTCNKTRISTEVTVES